MKIFSNLFICLVLVIGFSAVSFAGGTVDPTIMKSLNEGPDPVGTGKDATSTFKFTIEIDGDYDSEGVVEDVLPAEFDVGNTCTTGTVGECCTDDDSCDDIGTCDAGVTDLCIGGPNSGAACTTDADCTVEGTCDGDGFMASCGSATIEEKNKPGDKLRPDHVEWDLTGCSGLQTLMICMNTDLNPGHAKRGIVYYEPTSCGPLALNDGASLDGLITDPLVVATCLDETDMVGCVDLDEDGWSVDCGDCDDENADANPGNETETSCTDGADNDCDEDVDCADSDCSEDLACIL